MSVTGIVTAAIRALGEVMHDSAVVFACRQVVGDTETPRLPAWSRWPELTVSHRLAVPSNCTCVVNGTALPTETVTFCAAGADWPTL